MVAARGAKGDGLAVVLKGSLWLGTLNTEGREIIYSVIGAGRMWGLLAAIDAEGQPMRRGLMVPQSS